MIDKTVVKASGGCNCGGVRYEVSDRSKLRQVMVCHCDQCRRFSGHFFAASGALHRYFTLLESRTLKWHQYKPFMRRGFCSECGCSLFCDYPEQARISIAAGTLDDSSGLQEVVHICTEEAGCYYQLPDNVPLREDCGASLACPE